ncbi:MAG: 2-oxo acid dehydrogenase subunit E2 [Gammaproteobacteria bacterium]|nr:2-oxo acid dehydrogenase subunit E2 [Gammaproteobacteria bacterium]
MIEFRLPSLGADMDEGTLLEWRIAPGDRVRRGQIVAVVDTSKAAVDVECWQEGAVHELITRVGETVPVGTVMATLVAGAEGAAVVSAPAPESGAVRDTAVAAPAAATAGPAPAAVAAPAAPVPAPHRPVSPAARKHARERGIELGSVVATGGHGSVTVADVERAADTLRTRAPAARPPVSPAARRRARELGIDPATLTGSGAGGALILADVEAAAPAGKVDRHAAMRKAIAAAMSRSKREIPHYYLTETIPVQRALAWLEAANATRAVTARLLFVVLQLKAVALALRRYPELNGWWRDDAFEPGSGVHLGVAISLRQGGLVAPAIHDVDRLSLAELMRALADLVKRTRAGSLRSSELSDATITVTNLGDQGVESVLGVIYPPQVALVGFGRILARPWVDAGELSVARTVVASLTADHRASDGHRGGLFLAEIRDRLQSPETLDTAGQETS